MNPNNEPAKILTLDEAIEQMTSFVADLNDARDVTDIPSIMAMKATLSPILTAMEQAKAEIDSGADLIIRQGNILTGVVNALRSQPRPMREHSHHDAEELAQQAQARIAELEKVVEAAKAMIEVEDEECWHDHHGLCQAHNLRRNDAGEPECQVAMMRQALAALDKEGK